jgi:LCP family protein required for cell wall assembly
MVQAFKNNFSWRQKVYWGFALILSISAFILARRITVCWQLTALPGIPPPYCSINSEYPTALPDLQNDGAVGDDISSDTTVSQMDFPQWDGGSRINIAFFGLRGGEINNGDCPACMDTIILMTLDPVTKTAGMLSIPRDMWINIPGYGYTRINTAWTIGENSKLPGGGPGLAMKTVSQFIGVPVDYYVQVDFGTFVSFINMIGGVDVYVNERMVLDPAGPGQDHFVLLPGDFRHLNGRRALAYARCRDGTKGCSGGDFGRAKRQQQIILAIRDKVLDPTYFPTLLAQAPQLYTEFSSGIHTNMPLEDALKLAMLVQDIPVENIKQGAIDISMAVPSTVMVNGVQASVLRPVPDLIRVLRDEIFVPGGPLSPLAQGDSETLMQTDEARVRITNNSSTADLDKRTARFLEEKGMQVVEFGVTTGVSSQTKLILYSPKLYTLRYLVETFEIADHLIRIQPDSTETIDLEIRIGEDWVDKLPTGY